MTEPTVTEVDSKSIPNIPERKQELYKILSKEIQLDEISVELDRKCKWIMDKIIKKCKELNIDWFVVIVGGEGIGKTTLTLNLFAQTCRVFNRNVIATLIRTIVYDEEELLEFLTTIDPNEKFLPMFLDEGANILFNRDSMQRHRSYILKFFNVMRFLNSIVFITTPNIKFLDKNVRTHRVKSLFYIPQRGVYWYYDKPLLDRMLAIETYKRWYWIEPKVVGSYGVNTTLEKITTNVKKQYIQNFTTKVDDFMARRQATRFKL